MRGFTIAAFAAAWVLILSGTAASAATCTDFFESGQAPVTTGADGSANAQQFCHTFYAVLYSSDRKDPLWSAEHLTRAMAQGGDSIGRTGKRFGPQVGLSADQQGSHDDYTGSIYDRGHMTPADDAPTIATQKDTFVVSNIVPQTKPLNERLWQYLEAGVHQLAERDGDVYVVTGPIFFANAALLNDRVAIPAYTFKAIYVPSTGIAIAYIATNEQDPTCVVVSIAELQLRTGIDPFPGLAADVKGARPEFALPHGVHIISGRPSQVPLPNCHPAAAS
jgi:endonuclease G